MPGQTQWYESAQEAFVKCESKEQATLEPCSWTAMSKKKINGEYFMPYNAVSAKAFSISPICFTRADFIIYQVL